METNLADAKEMIYLGSIMAAVIIGSLILSYVTVSLRLWVRCRITRSASWDDAAIVATLLLFTFYCSFLFVLIARSQRNKLFQTVDVRMTLVFVQLSEVFYILTTTFLKISLGLFFLRVLTKRWQKLIFHSILAVSAVYGLFYVFVVIFQCGDPARIAESFVDSPRCLPAGFRLSAGYIYGAINIIADWTFVLIPITVLLDSELDRRSKISVSLVMALGAVGSIASVMRMVYLSGLQFHVGGLTPNSIRATIWATAEPGTGITAASAAILRPLIRHIRKQTTVYSLQQRSQRSRDRKNSLPLKSTPSVDVLYFRPGQYTLTPREDTNGLLSPPPLVEFGKASVQRVVSVQMVNGKGVPRTGSNEV